MEEILHHLIGRLSRYLQGLIHLSWCRISAINSIMQLARLQLSQLATSPSALCQLLSCHADSSGEHRNMSVDQVASPASIHTVIFFHLIRLISRNGSLWFCPGNRKQARIMQKLATCKLTHSNSAINFAFKNQNVPQAHDKKHERDHHWPGKDLKQSGNTTCNMHHSITNPNNANMQGSLHFIGKPPQKLPYIYICIV